jgi:hypothetical protein
MAGSLAESSIQATSLSMMMLFGACICGVGALLELQPPNKPAPAPEHENFLCETHYPSASTDYPLPCTAPRDEWKG